MHLSSLPGLSSLSPDLTHIQYRVVESRLKTLCQSKSVEIVLSIFVHLRKHLKVELTAQDTMIVTQNPQTIEETCLIRTLQRVDKKCFRM